MTTTTLSSLAAARSECGLLQKLTGECFTFGIFELRNGLFSDPHIHDAHSLCIGLSGSFSVKSSIGELQIAANDIVFLPSNFKHWEQATQTASCLLAFPQHADVLCGKLQIHGPGFVTGSNYSIANRIQAEISLNDDLTASQLDSICFGIGTELGPKARFCRHYARAIAERLKQESARPPSVALLANEYGFSRQHLARIFHSAFNCSIPEYIRRVRVQRAARLLKYSSEPLSEIAALSGFADQSHMTRSFKKETGCTPALYRRFNAGVRSAARIGRSLPKI